MSSRHILTFALAGTLVVSTAGCEPPVMRARMEVPRKTTQQVARDLRTTPDVARLVEELSREAAQGAVQGLVDEQTAERLHATVAELSRAMLDDLAAGVRGPAGREITAGVTRSMVRSISEELSASAGPAMRQVLVDELLRQPEFRQALNETSRDIGKQLAIGTAEAVTQPAKKEKLRGLFPSLSDFLPSGLSLLVLLGLLLALGLPFAMLLKQRRAARRYREDAERRAAVATALLEAAEADHDDPAFRSLLARVAASLTAEGGAAERPAKPREPPPGSTLRPA